MEGPTKRALGLRRPEVEKEYNEIKTRCKVTGNLLKQFWRSSERAVCRERFLLKRSDSKDLMKNNAFVE